MTAATRQCVILVGGLGSRLGARVRTLPKPLLPVAGRPFLEHLLLNARRHGFDDFVLLAGYRGARVARRYAPGGRFARLLDARLRVAVEPQPMGTAGAIAAALPQLARSFVVLNGDSFFDIDLRAFATAAAAQPCAATIALRRVENAARFGAVTRAGAAITGFREKSGKARPGVINGGVYWMRRAAMRGALRAGPSLERDVFPRLAAARLLCGRLHDGYFVDMGTPGDLAVARRTLGPVLRAAAARGGVA